VPCMRPLTAAVWQTSVHLVTTPRCPLELVLMAEARCVRVSARVQARGPRATGQLQDGVAASGYRTVTCHGKITIPLSSDAKRVLHSPSW
jgi:hypothetical protein